jgi:hypothetical protein
MAPNIINERTLFNHHCDLTICSFSQTKCMCHKEAIQKKNGFDENFSTERVTS